MKEIELRASVVKYAKKFIGCKKGDSLHKELIDYYNENVRIDGKLPRGHKVTYTDSYCATACSAWMQMAGLIDLIYPECGVGEMVNGCKPMGIWVEDDDYTPKTGDFITFCYTGEEGEDNVGWPKHIALINGVSGNVIHTINPNSGGAVIESDFTIGQKEIRGFICPDYASKADAQKTISGKKSYFYTGYDAQTHCNIQQADGIRDYILPTDSFPVYKETDDMYCVEVHHGSIIWFPWVKKDEMDLK